MEIINEINSNVSSEIIKENFINKLQIKNGKLNTNVSQIAKEILQIKEKDTILLQGENSEEIIRKICSEYNEITIIAKNLSANEVLYNKALNILKNKNNILINKNNCNLKNYEYNKIFDYEIYKFPNVKLEENTLFNELELRWKKSSKFIHHIYDFRKPTERAVYIMPASNLASTANLQGIKFLLDKGYIEGIIRIPNNSIKSTNINLVMLILSKNNIDINMADLSDTNIENIKINEYYGNNTANSIVLSKDDIKEQNYNLTPNIYILPVELNFSEYYYLSEVCEILRGNPKITKRNLESRITEESTNFKYLEVKNISDDFLLEDLDNLDFINDNELKYCADNEDIIMSRMNNFKTMILEKDENTNILISGGAYILKINKEKFNPYFLQLYFSNETVKKYISGFSSGTAMRVLAVSDLERIKIPKISLDVQNKCGDEYIKILNEYRKLREQREALDDNKEEMIKNIIKYY